MDPIIKTQLIFLAIAFALAFLVETLVEYIFGTPMDKVPKLKPYKWILMYVALVIGVLLVLFYKIDLIALIQAVIKEEAPNVTLVGMILTGLAVGRGSNYLHQFVSKFFPNAPVPKQIPDDPPVQ
jgi:hypothetical protein